MLRKINIENVIHNQFLERPGPSRSLIMPVVLEIQSLGSDGITEDGGSEPKDFTFPQDIDCDEEVGCMKKKHPLQVCRAGVS